MHDLALKKASLRRQMRDLRAARGSVSDAEAALAHIRSGLGLRPGDIVAGYAAIGTEIDPAPLLDAWHAEGRTLALPATDSAQGRLIFRRFQPGDRLVEGPHGTREPDAAAPVLRPGIVLVPLLAFDGAGFRLGYGKGYYDRALHALRRDGPVDAIGLAYAFQEVEDVPHGAEDAPLDAVATERGYRRFNRNTS